MQVINDDKGWTQAQQLSVSQVGDHTAIILISTEASRERVC